MSDTKSLHVQEIIQSLLNDCQHTSPFISLDEFVQVYQGIAKEISANPPLHVVLLGTNAAIQFPFLSAHRLIVREKRRLTEEDFTRTAVHVKVFGDKRKYSLSQQLIEEKHSLPFLLVVFSISFTLVVLMGFAAAPSLQGYLSDPNGYPLVALVITGMNTITGLVVTCATLFISIFLAFAIAQNVEFMRDDFLFREGFVQKYYRDDVFISIIALSALSLGLVNVVILSMPFAFQLVLSLGAATIYLNKLSFISPLLFALSVTALATCFASIFYYFRRNLAAVSMERATNLLDRLDEPHKKIRETRKTQISEARGSEIDEVQK